MCAREFCLTAQLELCSCKMETNTCRLKLNLTLYDLVTLTFDWLATKAQQQPVPNKVKFCAKFGSLILIYFRVTAQMCISTSHDTSAQCGLWAQIIDLIHFLDRCCKKRVNLYVPCVMLHVNFDFVFSYGHLPVPGWVSEIRLWNCLYDDHWPGC